MLDQVLGKALEADTEITPRFTTKDENGNIISQHITIERENPVEQEGSAWNKANACPDDVALKFGLDSNSNPQVKDCLDVISRLHNGLGNEYMWSITTSEATEYINTPTNDAPSDNAVYLGQLGGFAKIQRGSYVGNGVRSRRVAIPENTILILISSSVISAIIPIPNAKGITVNSTTGLYGVSVTYSTNTNEIIIDDFYYQNAKLNVSGTTYTTQFILGSVL